MSQCKGKVFTLGLIGEDDGCGQIKYYTNDPNAELVKPGNTEKPAMAYKLTGSGPIYGWRPDAQLWN